MTTTSIGYWQERAEKAEAENEQKLNAISSLWRPSAMAADKIEQLQERLKAAETALSILKGNQNGT